MAEQFEIDAAVQKVEVLLNGLMAAGDSKVRSNSEQLVRVLMQMYGAGLERIVKIVRQSADSSQELLEQFADDQLVASLLLIHGLHPVSAEDRIRRALARIERRLDGCQVVLENLAGGTARVRVNMETGAIRGGPTAALGATIEHSIRESAPDVERIEIQGIAHGNELIQIGESPNS